MLNVFPNVCYLFPQFSEKNSYLENLFSSKSRKLYQQNTSVVLVSVKNSAHLSADAQISPDLPCVYILGHESQAFWLFWRKTRGFEHQLSWASSGRDWADLASLLCPGGLDLPCVFESRPNTSCYGTSNWSNKRARPIRAKRTWVLGKLLNTQGKPRPTASWIRKLQLGTLKWH